MFLVLFLIISPHKADTLDVMFWNLENFFDYRNDSTSVSDAEFSSRGAKRWTKKRFYAKCNAVAKGILWAGGKMGAFPDVIGVAEVENAFVLRRLLQATALSKLDYKLVHFESPDRRGIDVALMYRSSRMELCNAKPCHIFEADSNIMRTRDILAVVLKGRDSVETAFLVNHHPSKFGGAAISGPRRERAIKRLGQIADSLRAEGVTRIIAMGDFNDTPANPLFQTLDPPLKNNALPLHRKGEGTIKYAGRWELIDMFFSCGYEAGMEILYIPFLQTPDKSATGTKPLRTYSGPRYLGGVSDHCPIWLHCEKK